MAGTARLLAAAAMGTGVIVLIYNLIYGIGGIPQSGPIRFGMPMAVIVAAVIGARRPGLRRAAWIASLLILALSSIWALEAFVYTLVVLAAIACLEAYLAPAGERRARLLRQAVQVIAACVLAQLIFALATLAFAGQLPDWGQYLAYLRRFVIGPLGDFTYDIAPWSPGLAVGAAYLVSAAAIVQLAWRSRELVERERVAFVALAGTTAYGIALFSYLRQPLRQQHRAAGLPAAAARRGDLAGAAAALAAAGAALGPPRGAIARALGRRPGDRGRLVIGGRRLPALRARPPAARRRIPARGGTPALESAGARLARGRGTAAAAPLHARPAADRDHRPGPDHGDPDPQRANQQAPAR